MPAATTITLSIRFGGLCLFARDPEHAQGPRLHALLPTFGDDDTLPPPGHEDDPHAPGHGPVHHPRLFLDSRLVGQASQTPGKVRMNCVRYRGYAVELRHGTVVPEPAGDRFPVPELDPRIGSMARIADDATLAAVQRDYADHVYDPVRAPKPPAGLAARVTLAGGFTEVVDVGDIQTWSNGTVEHHFEDETWRGELGSTLLWTQQVRADAPVQLVFTPLDSLRTGFPLTLTPQGGRIDLFFVHAPRIDLLPRRERKGKPFPSGFPADHFQGLYVLFPPGTDGRIPELVTGFTSKGRPADDIEGGCPDAAGHASPLSRRRAGGGARSTVRFFTITSSTCTPGQAGVAR